jgi:thiamine kinase-like enzyme
VTADLESTEVARAWFAVSGEQLKADNIEILRQARETTAFRLHTRDGSIVAKRCTAETATLERRIYVRVLSRLALPTLGFHGATAASDPRLRWLFIEDAKGERYEPSLKEHRRAAGRWLAELHCAVVNHPVRHLLPARRTDHYERLLRSVLQTLHDVRAAACAAERDRLVELEAVIAHCDRLRLRWKELERACETGWDTLVHGDVVTHNAQVRNGPSGLEFLPFDWEKAGWGTAAEDLANVDIETYRDTVEAEGSAIDRYDIIRLAGAGKAFRCLVFLQWLAPDLLANAGDAHEQLRLCRSWLDEIMESTPWAS